MTNIPSFQWRALVLDGRGFLTIPKKIKDALRLGPGGHLSMAVHEGVLVLLPDTLGDDQTLTELALHKLGIPPAPAPVAVAAQPQPVPVPAAAPFHGWSHQDVTKLDNRCRLTLPVEARNRLGIPPDTLVLTDVRIDYDGTPVMVLRALTPQVTLKALSECRALKDREQALAEAQEQLEADRAALDRREEELNARVRMWDTKAASNNLFSAFTPASAPVSPAAAVPFARTPSPETPPVVIPFAKTPVPAAPPPFPAFIFPDAQPTPASTYCSICNLPQWDTPSGRMCADGHGGAPSVEKAPPGQLWKNGVLVDDISDGDGKAS